MSCDACRDIEEHDGDAPPCRNGGGGPGIDACWLPSLGDAERRALGLRTRAMALKDLMGAEAVLRMHGATAEDMEMLAVIEDELKD